MEEGLDLEQDLSGDKYTVIRLAIRPDLTKERNSREERPERARSRKVNRNLLFNEIITVLVLTEVDGKLVILSMKCLLQLGQARGGRDARYGMQCDVN